ncbi:hypothetical protein CBP34_12355 [Acidovorax carolinensis]|uniref:Uncharacterized protein n=1 Tax=Acidovorax carolinensis TaxID=553814 RepID=A0A240U4E5_9BURK|nr:hypothetical protein CBP34_12355 [Acidovorax carolinensis]
MSLPQLIIEFVDFFGSLFVLITSARECFLLANQVFRALLCILMQLTNSLCDISDSRQQLLELNLFLRFGFLQFADLIFVQVGERHDGSIALHQ